MKVISYVVTHDYGFAPNPFHGFLTLATCKPTIRRSRNTKKGDVLLGKAAGKNKLIYVAIISDIISIEEYSTNPQFEAKKPTKMKAGRPDDYGYLGDNMHYVENGCWRHLEGWHKAEWQWNADVSGKNVLICKEFWYFGDKAPDIPNEFLSFICQGRGMKHSKDQDKDDVENFMLWLKREYPEQGLLGKPSLKYFQAA